MKRILWLAKGMEFQLRSRVTGYVVRIEQSGIWINSLFEFSLKNSVQAFSGGIIHLYDNDFESFQLLDNGRLTSLVSLRVGQTLSILPDSPLKQELKGRVVLVNPVEGEQSLVVEIDEGQRQGPFVIGEHAVFDEEEEPVNAQSIRLGMPVEVEILSGKAEVLNVHPDGESVSFRLNHSTVITLDALSL